MKIEILGGWVDLNEKLCREVDGIIVINDRKYIWGLYTDDGFTSCCVVVDGEDLNLEDEDDCEQLGLTEDEGLDIFEEILDLVEDEGYSIEGWDE